MNIHIEFIDPSQMRSADEIGPSAGDYFVRDGELVIQIAKTGTRAYDLLVAHHELTERILTELRGIPDEAIDKFDREHPDLDIEPGDLPDAPYGLEHGASTGFERILCSLLGIKWSDYDSTVMTGAKRSGGG